jgi:hypothetical protein
VFWDFEVYSHFCKTNKANSKKSYMNIQCLEYSSLFSANNWDDLWQIACGSATNSPFGEVGFFPNSVSEWGLQPKYAPVCAGAGVGLGSTRFRKVPEKVPEGFGAEPD